MDSDVETYWKAYAANPDSRWNTPEMAALATDVVRKLAVYHNVKVFWDKHGHTFQGDMKELAKADDEEFTAFQLNL